MVVGCVAIQHSKGYNTCSTACAEARDTEPATRRGMPETRCGTPATRSTTGHDTAGAGPRHGDACALPGRSARGLCVQPGPLGVHPTQFWTQCTISITIWTTIHKHCSQDFSKKSNQIKSNLLKN